MRPRLRQLRPKRPLTLPRLLTVPFEAALARGSDQDWPFSIGRGRLGDWHRLIIEGLPPNTGQATKALIEGRAADDEPAILEAGPLVWPAAAELLAADCPPGEKPEERTDRLRAADLLGIAVELVPLHRRLLPPRDAFDAEDKETARAILALAEAGPPDRLGLLTGMLLRAAVRPAAVVPSLLDLAPASLRPGLRPLLDQFAAHHQALLEQRVTDAATAEERPLEEVADAFWRLADELVGPAGRAAAEAPPDSASKALRQRAAGIAGERYAAAMTSVVAPLPETSAAAEAARVAAVKAREADARRLARLGRAARRLDPETPIERLTESALRRLVDPAAALDRAIDVDDARLVEILGGPDLAWQLLRPNPGNARRA